MPSILIADDNPDLREILTTVFAGAGMDVVTAADGDTALRLAVQSAPDVVLADFDMPGLTGVQLCHAMREHQQLRSVPFAILTGYLVAGDSQIGELSCCTVMFQPSSNKELLAVMHTLLERGNHDHDPQGHCLSSDDITALAAQAAEPSYLMFSPPYPELNTSWPVADGDSDDPYEDYPPTLPLPDAHPHDPRVSVRSRRYSAAPTGTEQ